MEKTLARAIYKMMEVGKEYTTSDLSRLIGDDYYKYIPEDMQPFQANGKPVNCIIASEMWKVVKTGYATTRTEQQTLLLCGGVKFGCKPKDSKTYNVRYWKRVK